MIRALVFDLDGTLVQTERLKALSYALAVRDLCPRAVETGAVIEAFREVVGLPRREVALHLMERFDLEAAAGRRMPEFAAATPWQALVELRLQHYQRLIADPAVVREHRWPFAIDLLHAARDRGCSTALATMSHARQVRDILDALGLAGTFTVMATRDDVERGKPDPEIYRLVERELRIEAQDALVIEDSRPGVEAALAAGCRVIAVATPFTHPSLHAMQQLAPDHLVDDPATLVATVERVFDDARQHPGARP